MVVACFIGRCKPLPHLRHLRPLHQLHYFCYIRCIVYVHVACVALRRKCGFNQDSCSHIRPSLGLDKLFLLGIRLISLQLSHNLNYSSNKFLLEKTIFSHFIIKYSLKYFH